MANKTNDQDPNDPYPLDPADSRNTLVNGVTGGQQGITDPKGGFPTGPLTSDSDPRLTNGAYATDPDVLKYINDVQGYGPAGNYQGKGPVAPPTTTSANLSDPSAWMSMVGDTSKLTQWVQSILGPNANPADVNYYVGKVQAQPGQNTTEQAGGASYWTNKILGGGGEAGPAAPAGPSGPSVGSASTSVGPNANTAAYNEQIRQILLSQIAGLSGPTTADSQDVAPAISAFNTQSQRDQVTNRDALAERFYAGSDGGAALDSGGFNTSVKQGLEKAATDRANFTGSTIYTASQAKRQQLQQMLQTATSAGQTDAAQQIQAKIAEIDADLRRQGLTQQNSQFGDSLGFNYAQLIAQNNRDTLLAGLRPNG